jgi:hypothetical protein
MSFSTYYSDAPPLYGTNTSRGQPLNEDNALLPLRALGNEQYADDDLDSQDIAILDQGIRSIPPPICSRSSYPRLAKIIIIPQISLGSKLQPPMPFTRVYPPSLSSYDLSKHDFLTIIDTFNISLSASPPFQLLQLASTGIGFVPYHWALVVSAGLGVLAAAGTAATCYVRTKRFMDKINREVWEPRGLVMSMVKDPEVLRMLGLSEQAVLSRMSTAQPQIPGLVPDVVSKRRFQALQSLVAELDFDVPPPENPRNILDKLSAKQQARKVSKAKKKSLKEQHKRDRKREEVMAKYGDQCELNVFDYGAFSSSGSDSSIAGPQKDMSKMEREVEKLHRKCDEKLIGASQKKVAKIERERRQRLAELQEGASKNQRELSSKKNKELDKLDEKTARREEKEHNKLRKQEWIVIKNLDDI